MESIIVRREDRHSGTLEEYRSHMEDLIQFEVNDAIEPLIRAATRELAEEQRTAIRKAIEENRLIVRQVVEEERTAIQSRVDDLKRSIARMGTGK